MKKQSVAQGTLILIVAGFITKILGMVNRIIITRLLGDSGVGIYMLIAPTMMLLMTVASIGLPVAIPTLISRANKRQKEVLTASFVIAMVCSLIMSIILFFVAKPLAVDLLKDERTYLPLISLGPLLFFVSISCIFKGYFQGEQNMYPSAISTFIEQIVRLFLSIVFISWLLPYGIIYGIVGTIWASIAGEISSIIILFFMFIKNMKINHPRGSLKPTKLRSEHYKDVMAISLPATGSRLIGSFTHFLEPIIVVQCLYKLGYASEMSAKMYGAVSGFALPMLMMPSFITHAISQAIVPPISQAYAKGQYERIHSHLDNAFQLSFLPAGIATVILMLFPYELMELLYDTPTGAQYLFIMAPFFLLLYFQGTLTATLQAIDQATKAMSTTLISSIIKIVMMFVLLSIPSININGLVIAILFNVVFITCWHFIIVRKRINYRGSMRSVINAILTLGITYMLGSYLIQTTSFFPNQNVNMLIVILIITLAYLFLLIITGLFPAKQMSRTLKTK
ncbi:MAG: stage V sporulation protein B [Turicibacter sp.]